MTACLCVKHVIPLDTAAGNFGGSLTPCFHVPQGFPGPKRLDLPWGMLMFGPGESWPRMPKAPDSTQIRNDVKWFFCCTPLSLESTFVPGNGLCRYTHSKLVRHNICAYSVPQDSNYETSVAAKQVELSMQLGRNQVSNSGSAASWHII